MPLSVFIIISGISLLIYTLFYTKEKQNRTKAIVITLIFLMVGIVTLIGSLLLSEKYQAIMWFMIIGLVFISVDVYWIKNLCLCKIMLSALCIKINAYDGGRGVMRYSPVFRYIYQGKDYESQSVQQISKSKRFQPGQAYTVYISEREPSRVIWRRRLGIDEVSFFVVGVFFLGFGVFLILV